VINDDNMQVEMRARRNYARLRESVWKTWKRMYQRQSTFVDR